MSYEKSIENIATDAMKLVDNNQILGLGSGRAATTLVRELGKTIKADNFIRGVPTSLQIKEIAIEVGIELIEPSTVSHIDIIFDGADQIDEDGYMVKGGGGALLRENILASMADTVVIMADQSKFVKNLCMPIPVEVHPVARRSAVSHLGKIGSNPTMRVLDRGYPMFTENSNIILDCDFGVINNPATLAAKIKQIPGVMEVGIFKKPNIIYKAQTDGNFVILHP